MPSGTLIFDVETHSRELMYTMPPEEFVRLIGYKWKGDDRVTITTDLEQLRAVIRRARWIIGHNIHDFDLRAVFGIRSDEPVMLAIEKRVYDTWTHAALVNPCPSEYVNRFGQRMKEPSTGKIDWAKKWYSLDEQAFQLGVAGKTASLRELAREFGDPALKMKDRERDGFGKIPVDDPRYVAYLIGDVEASERVAEALLQIDPLDPYAMREQEIEARKAVISSNGLRLNQEKAQAREDSLAARRAEILDDLNRRYGLPDSGASPWSTDPGKRAILAALADYGIAPDTVEWPRTPGWDKKDEKLKEARAKVKALRVEIAGWKAELAAGELRPASARARERWIEKAQAEIRERTENPLPVGFGLSLSGDTLVELTKSTPAESLGQALAELKGQRSLAQLALDSVYPDGFVHPEITMLQRSGRWSTTEPGLTVWTNNGPGRIEKDYFEADSDDDVLMEFDYSNADARAVAAESGDTKYAIRFEPGQDGHMINAIAAWGAEVVATNPDGYRQDAKVPGHGWGYRIGVRKLALGTGLPETTCRTFLDGMNKTFRRVVEWQQRCEKFARKHGYILNGWGRKMRVEKGREYNQPPALVGQSTTREIGCDFLLSLPLHVLRRVKAQIHDAFLFSLPKENWEECRDYILDRMSVSYEPAHGNGQRIEFPASAGPPGRTWFEAIH